MWREVLGISRVGRHDNFFDLGGHSLLVPQVHRRLKQHFDGPLTIVDLFRYPTVSALAAHLAGAGARLDTLDASIQRAGLRRAQRTLRVTRAQGARGTAWPHRQDGRLMPQEKASADSRIAVIGMACRVPGAEDVEAFWDNVVKGRESIEFLSEEELRASGVPAALALDSRYVPAGGFVADVESFDAALFGYTPREAALLDPQHRLLLECAWHALEHAGYGALEHQARVGIFTGVANSAYFQRHVQPSLADTDPGGAYQALISGERDFVATRLSYQFDVSGPSVNVQTACSTSLVAVHLACQALLGGECDMALAGGAAVRLPQKIGTSAPGRHDPVVRRPLPAVRRAGERHGRRQRRRHRRAETAGRRPCRRRSRACRDPGLGCQQRRRREGGLHGAERDGAVRGDRRGAGARGCGARNDRLRRGTRHRYGAGRSDRGRGAHLRLPADGRN